MKKTIIYLISVFIFSYGMFYFYLGYKFDAWLLYLIASIFSVTSISLFLQKEFSHYLVFVCFLIITFKAILNSYKLINEDDLGISFQDVTSTIGGDLIIVLLFFLFSTIVCMCLKKN